MVLEFCPKCGNLLIPRREGDKFYGECEKCNFSKELKVLKTMENLEPKKKIGKGIRKEENPFATYSSKCPKCGYGKAQIIDMGIFYSDEDNLILLKCGRCGHSERIGRKTT